MKEIKFKSTAFACLLAASGFLAGCSSEDTPVYESNNYDNPPVPVSVSVSGDDWERDETSTRAGASAVEKVLVPLENGYCLSATLEPAAGVQTRAATPLTAGIRYRVIAYRQGDVSASGYVGHADYVVGGTAPDFWLPVDCTYTFVCYSYGTTSALPAFSSSAVSLSVSPDQDVLYYKSDVAITASNSSFSIAFTHVFSQLTVVAASNGDNITSCSAALSPGYSATLPLSTGVAAASGTSSPRSVSWSSPNGVSVSSAPSVVFTNAETVTLTFSSITIGSTTLTDKSVTFTGNTMSVNTQYTLTVTFKKAPGIVIPGISVYWAKSNLRSPDGGVTFSFQDNPYDYSGVWDGGDYFCWNTLNPLSLTSSNTTAAYDPATDPCRQVAPAGTWRMPTQTECEALVASGCVWGSYGGKNGYFFGTTTVPAEANKPNYLFLPAAGNREYGSATMFNVGVHGNYWSATRYGTTEAYRLYFYSTFVNGTQSNYRNLGYTVRCVSDQ